MKLTNGEIVRAILPMRDVMGIKLPVKVAYGFAQISAKLNEQYAIIEAVRKGLFETYGRPDPKNLTNLQMLEEFDTHPKFKAELDELMSQEVELVIDQVTLPDTQVVKCPKCGELIERPLEIEPSILMILSKLIKVA